MPPIVMESNSPNPIVNQPAQNGALVITLSSQAIVNIDNEIIMAVTTNLMGIDLIGFVTNMTMSKKTNVDAVPIGTSRVQVGDAKLDKKTPRLTPVPNS